MRSIVYYGYTFCMHLHLVRTCSSCSSYNMFKTYIVGSSMTLRISAHSFCLPYQTFVVRLVGCS